MQAQELVSEQSEEFKLAENCMEKLRETVQSASAKIANRFHKTRNDLLAGRG